MFRPFNWIGAGLDSINDAQGRFSSRVITQFLGHIVRGEPIKLVDGGAQKRAFTYVDDGIAALMKIIENPDGIASGKIYNIGNPANNYSIRELSDMMLKLAATYPEYRDNAAKVQGAGNLFGAVLRRRATRMLQNRVPKITNTMADLGWKPVFTMEQALKGIFDAYKGHVAEARSLID